MSLMNDHRRGAHLNMIFYAGKHVLQLQEHCDVRGDGECIDHLVELISNIVVDNGCKNL